MGNMSNVVKKSDLPGSWQRVAAIDVLRGLAIVLMMLDHSRDFINREAVLFNPTDLTQTNIWFFFTRWVSHFCAPTFIFLAGVSVALQVIRGTPKPELARFLIVRGLFLIAIELIVLRPLIWFNFDFRFLAHLQVIWVIGWSMIVLAGLIFLPRVVIAVFGLVLVAGHNTNFIEQVVLESGSIRWPVDTWREAVAVLLHRTAPIVLPWPPETVVFAHYPLVPWVGVMALGFVVGSVYRLKTNERRRILFALGIATTAAFVVLRWVNVYGDSNPWLIPSAEQSPRLSDWQRAVLSFVNTEKYPPSLQFLCMTIGPGLLFLAWTDQREPRWLGRRLMVYGSVPLFFYILQWPTVHLMSRAFQLLAGQPIGWDGANQLAPDFSVPEGIGFSLGVTYLGWIIGLMLLYPLCAWFRKFKRRNRHHWWLSLF